MEEMVIELNPEWTICKRFTCGHIQHACCRRHLDKECPICIEPPPRHKSSISSD